MMATRKDNLILWKIWFQLQAFSNLWEEAAAKKKTSWSLQDNHFCNYSSMGILKEFYFAVVSVYFGSGKNRLRFVVNLILKVPKGGSLISIKHQIRGLAKDLFSVVNQAFIEWKLSVHPKVSKIYLKKKVNCCIIIAIFSPHMADSAKCSSLWLNCQETEFCNFYKYLESASTWWKV